MFSVFGAKPADARPLTSGLRFRFSTKTDCDDSRGLRPVERGARLFLING